MKKIPQVRYNKLWGLKKIRTVCKKLPSNVARFAPFKVYRFPEEHKAKNARNLPRLLVRTDEKGKTYQKLSHATVPRFEVLASEWNPKEARDQISSKTHEPSRFFERHGRFIVHPTRLREHVDWTGVITVIPRKAREPDALIRIDWGQGSKTGDIVFLQKYSGIFLFSDLDQKRIYWPAEVPTELANRVLVFLKKAIQTRQLNLRREHEIAFNTWKDDPKTPEFYDWREFRKQPQKKTKN